MVQSQKLMEQLLGIPKEPDALTELVLELARMQLAQRKVVANDYGESMWKRERAWSDVWLLENLIAEVES